MSLSYYLEKYQKIVEQSKQKIVYLQSECSLT